MTKSNGQVLQEISSYKPCDQPSRLLSCHPGLTVVPQLDTNRVLQAAYDTVT